MMCGLFKPLVMYFSLTNSLATLQTMMNNIFKGLIDEGYITIYMDNIVIFTWTIEHHWEVVSHVLNTLWRYWLYLKAEKCSFKCSKVEYLGLILSEGHIEMDPVKIAGVKVWPTPKRHILEGTDHTVEILNDHRNLTYFQTAQNLNHRQACWSLYLSQFNYSLMHRAGRHSTKPDALSRWMDH